MRRIVSALLVRDGAVLLAKRSPAKRAYPNTWSLPGGHVEPGEALDAALVREVGEEVGLGSRDKVGGRNEFREATRSKPLANQGIHSAAADYNLPFHARSQQTECNVVSGLGSLRNFVPRP